MKKILFIITILLFGCSEDDGSNDNDQGMQSNFEINLTSQSNIISIDEPLTINVLGNEVISRLDVSKDNWVTSANLASDSFGNQTDIFVDYETIGNQTISVRATNEANFTSEASINVVVNRGEAIELSSLQLNSFFNVDETWDDEFDEGDTNRLADVFFILLKPRLNPFDGNRSIGTPVWYRSNTLTNQGDLQWSLQNQNLLINPELSVFIAFADDDENGLVDDLMLGPPFEREVSFIDFISTQPSSIPVSFPGINLDFDLEVQW